MKKVKKIKLLKRNLKKKDIKNPGILSEVIKQKDEEKAQGI